MGECVFDEGRVCDGCEYHMVESDQDFKVRLELAAEGGPEPMKVEGCAMLVMMGAQLVGLPTIPKLTHVYTA